MNVIAGNASLVDQKGIPQTLKTQQELDAGDEIQVGPKSYVEVLLNPGSYLRLSSNARVKFLHLAPDNLKLRLLRGSLILETFVTKPASPNRKQTAEDMRMMFGYEYQGISVLTPTGDVVTAAGGIYRCDIDDSGRGFLAVRKGVAIVAGGILSDDMATALGDRVPVIQDIARQPEDPFDIWSHGRADSLTAANLSLRSTSWQTRLRKNHLSYLNVEYDEGLDRMKEAMTIKASGESIAFVEQGAQYQSDDGLWNPLTTDADLKDGDRIATGSNARVEIHLFPECYLLLAHHTEIIYHSRPDQGPAITIIQGSAMVVSTLARTANLVTSLIAPEGSLEIPGPGIFRLNVYPHRSSEALVYQGSASIREQELGAGNKAVLAPPNFAVEQLRQKDIDPFELWSRSRSSLLVQTLNPPRSRGFVPPVELTHYEVDIFKHRVQPAQRSHRITTAGMWYLDRAAHEYTFVPATNSRYLTSPLFQLLSPYGGKYSVFYRLNK